MKKIQVLVITLLVSLTSCSQKSKTEKSTYKKYPFKSAIVEYVISGNSTGTKTTYITDYGYKQAELSEITTNIMGFKSIEKKGVITVGAIINTIDYKKKTVVKTNSPYAESYAKNVGEDYIKVGEEMLIGLGFKKSGTETILGKSCTIWKGINTIWAWKGLVLKSETSIMGVKIVETATSVKTGVDVSPTKFETPSDYNVQEISNVGGFNDLLSEFDNADAGLTNEDRKMMKQVQNMSFEDFRKMMKKEDPEMLEEDIKNTYKMMKQFLKN